MISAAPIRGMLAPYQSHFLRCGQGANQPQNPLRINCFTTLHCHPYLPYYLKSQWQGSNTISLYPNIGIRLNTNSRVFKCALTYTHSIAGQGISSSLPYLGRFFSPSDSITVFVHELPREYNNNSPGDRFDYLVKGTWVLHALTHRAMIGF
jgi:hypothetical protein